MDLLPLTALLPILVVVALIDAGRLRIPNWVPAIGAAGFLVVAPSLPFLEAFMRVEFAVLGACAAWVMHSFRVIGAGDAKILPVVLLFVPTGSLEFFLLAVALGLTVCSGGIAAARGLLRRAATGHGAALRPHGPVPIALSMAVAGGVFFLADAPL